MSKFRVLLAGLLACLALAMTAPAHAVTATVPNYFYCSLQTGKCLQTNGGYERSVPTYCHWVFQGIFPGNRNISLCDKWV